MVIINGGYIIFFHTKKQLNRPRSERGNSCYLLERAVENALSVLVNCRIIMIFWYC